jgi:hypothetical protein
MTYVESSTIEEEEEKKREKEIMKMEKNTFDLYRLKENTKSLNIKTRRKYHFSTFNTDL